MWLLLAIYKSCMATVGPVNRRRWKFTCTCMRGVGLETIITFHENNKQLFFVSVCVVVTPMDFDQELACLVERN